MDFIARLSRDLAYNAWANREALHSLLKAGNARIGRSR